MADLGLLEAGERAAFHGRPADGVAPLQQYLYSAWQTDPERPHAQWLLGVCLAAGGMFGGSAAQLQPLLSVPAEADLTRRRYAAAAAGTLASIHRQVGRFVEARNYDEWAGAIAADDPKSAFDAALGLAADAVGAGAAQLAVEYVNQATGLCRDDPEWWRERVRLGWVQAEVSMLWDRPADARTVLLGSVAEAESVGAPRHVAKSLSFLGVAQQSLGDNAAMMTLGRAALLAESLGAWPLVWATRGLMAVLLRSSNPPEAERCRRSAEHAVRIIAADLPAELAEEWAARADVAPLLVG
ncbi:MAG: hypothetical protein QG671_1759 [Actinomycetota bacterium]|nr:hypothetical protein [Actinomycetota bacterium]